MPFQLPRFPQVAWQSNAWDLGDRKDADPARLPFCFTDWPSAPMQGTSEEAR